MSQEMERSSELTPLWLLGRLAESGVALRLPPRSKMSPATWGCAADSPPRFPPCVFFHLRGTMGRDVQAGIHPHCAILPPSRRVGDLCDAVAVSNRQNGDVAAWLWFFWDSWRRCSSFSTACQRLTRRPPIPYPRLRPAIRPEVGSTVSTRLTLATPAVGMARAVPWAAGQRPRTWMRRWVWACAGLSCRFTGGLWNRNCLLTWPKRLRPPGAPSTLSSSRLTSESSMY